MNKLKIKINLFILALFTFVAILFYFLSNGEYSNIGSDFLFYYNRLVFIRDFNVPINEWFSNSLDYPSEMDLFRVTNFVPTPFYTLIFLGPLILHGSNLLFALQGIGVAYLTFKTVRIHLKEIYFPIKEWKLNWILIIGSLNPAFLKEALTSGPIAVCNLFILYGFLYKDKAYLSSFLFCCAAMTRASYSIYWLAMFLACLIGSRSYLKKFLLITFPSLIIFIIFYIFFYSTYPESGFSFFFKSAMKGMDFMDNFFVSALSKHYEIADVKDILNLHASMAKASNFSLIEFLKLIFKDANLAYGAFVVWIFKILSSLGFRHLTLLWDMRNIFVQRFATLIYFLIIMGPAFFSSIICLLNIPKNNKNFWLDKERTILIFSVLFLLIHSLIWGEPRYATTISWIYVAFFIRFITWFRSITNKNFLLKIKNLN